MPFVLRDGVITNVGAGLVELPPGASEEARWRQFHPSGQAVGVDSARVQDDRGGHVARAVGFHWGPNEGVTPIALPGVEIVEPMAVNRFGVVVANGNGSAYVWTKDSGAVRLKSLVRNLPTDSDVAAAIAIGDSGHILAYVGIGLTRLALLKPTDLCLSGS